MSDPLVKRPVSTLRRLLSHEASGGLILIASAVAALVVANSSFAPRYAAALHYELLGLSILHWINDALMALFFVLVGLEIKRELLDGQLASWPHRTLPGVAAAGGMVVPALIYLMVNAASPATLRGWAIPAATDIAFSLGVLALLGRRVPVALKVFLTALAILDDLGAIVIIALFYSNALSPLMLALSGATFAALLVLNRVGVAALTPYLGLGALLWFFVLNSGVHATVAGVLLAVTIPLRQERGRPDDAHSPLHRLENALQPFVSFLILPLFAFANAGAALGGGIGIQALLQPVAAGTALGLFVGKQVGVFGAIWLAVRSGLARRPAGVGWLQLYGLSLLCGIGFTMSLFIGLLAFGDASLQDQTKIGVLAGSLLSAVAGWAVLRFARKPAAPRAV